MAKTLKEKVKEFITHDEFVANLEKVEKKGEFHVEVEKFDPSIPENKQRHLR